MPSKDFKSDQIRVTKLIASGGLSGGGAPAGNNIGLAIYSASKASDIAGGIGDSSMLDKVGKDVMLFISGSTSPAGRGIDGGSITLFGGDSFISGAQYFEKLSAAPGTVTSDAVVLYSKVDSGNPKLFYKYGSTEVGPLGSGGASSLLLYAENGSPGGSPSATNGPSIAIGDGATASATHAFVGGGNSNAAREQFTATVGGYNNIAYEGAKYVAVVGGYQNLIGKNTHNSAPTTNYYGFIGGGFQNKVGAEVQSGSLSAIVGGQLNKISSTAGEVGSALRCGIFGGSTNTIHGSDNSIILGGTTNQILGSPLTSGASNNASNALVGPGQECVISGSTLQTATFSTVVNGFKNHVSSSLYTSIVGGLENKVGADQAGAYPGDMGPQFALIGGGYRNSITGSGTGGSRASHTYILGGEDNRISLTAATNNKHGYILGGENNLISGRTQNVFILGSNNTITTCTSSFAIGDKNVTGTGLFGKPRILMGWNIEDTNAAAADKCHVVIGNGASAESAPGGSNPNTLITMSGSVKFTNTDHKGWIQSIPYLGSCTAHSSNSNFLTPFGSNNSAHSPTITYLNAFIAPANGKLVEIIYRGTAGHNSSNMSIIFSAASDGDAVSTSASFSVNSFTYPIADINESKTIDPTTGTGTMLVTKGQLINVNVQSLSTTAPGNVNISAKFQWNYNT